MCSLWGLCSAGALLLVDVGALLLLLLQNHHSVRLEWIIIW